MVEHLGLEIPEILYVLYLIIEQTGGFTADGIFRIAGNHDEMIQMIQDYDNGNPIQCKDVYSAATLIKVCYSIIIWSNYINN